MTDAVQDGLDTLANLEERITRAVEVVTNLRSENKQLAERLKTTQGQLEATKTELNEANVMSAELEKENSGLEQNVQRLSGELDDLRGERKQVKARVEKLLTQLDLLSVS